MTLRSIAGASMTLVGALVVVPCLAAAQAQPAPRVIPLWPEGVPNAQPGGGEERLEDGRVYNV